MIPSPAAANNGTSPPPTAQDGADSGDAIQQTKEKARAVFAAGMASHNGSPAPPSRPSSKAPNSAGLFDRPASGSPALGNPRKRSRSGSRVPTGPSHPDTTRLLIQQYISRDQAHSAAIERDQARASRLVAQLTEDKALLERFRARRITEAPQNPTRILYPVQRRPPFGRRTPQLRIPGKDRQRQAETLEDLVPIRLDLEFEKLRLRDTFTWNIHDRTVNPAVFAQGLVEDFKIPPEASEYFIREVLTNMKDQIQEFHPHIYLEEEAMDPHLPYVAYKNDEMRVQIKLNITIGPHTLVDSFDWDINDPHNSPEEFARQMALDLSLSGEFMTAIAHCIREQSELFTKALYASGHPFDGRPVDDSDIRENMLPTPVSSAYRPFQSAKEHAPYFYELNEADVERTELAFSREQRQQKRSTNRRGGPMLPDLKERLKTWRTMVVSSVIPGSAESVERSGVYRVSRSKRRPWNAGRGGEDDEEGSGDSEEESDPESPVRPQQLYGGTSRTRGMRGAASAAQAAMRAINRSVSPEKDTFQETKKLTRRHGAGPVFAEYDEAGYQMGLTLKLKLPRERFRQWWRDWKKDAPRREAEAARKAALLQQQQQHQLASLRGTPQLGGAGTPGPGGSMGPPNTPGMGGQPSRPSSSGPAPTPPPGSAPAASPGANVAASPVPGAATSSPAAPPVPDWVRGEIAKLASRYPEDRFEAIMRKNREPGAGMVPRIKCYDCPGNVYLVDENLTNFETHLKLGKHIERRVERTKSEKS